MRKRAWGSPSEVQGQSPVIGYHQNTIKNQGRLEGAGASQPHPHPKYAPGDKERHRLARVSGVFMAFVFSSLQITNPSFTYTSPYLWNQLPSSFRQPHSVHSPPGSPHPAHITSSQSPPSLSSPITPSTFHSRLKTHLFHKSFPP